MGQSKVAYGKVAAPARTGAVPSRESLITLPYLTGVMVLLTLVSIFHVWSRVEVIDLNLKISESARLLKEEQQENKRLKVEVASLKAPARIEVLAKGELGMTLPTEQQVVLVK
ncbi:cell division protein FtsL [Geomonas limicola]|uniref:Cell division protein FtsL n=1 Tax=Geomonas limicola TaxID=2740186 RepID=A0A6V8NAK5_9BACT|nr:cell division protein FtsL [Geomonas limicola]GFO68894.1 cell division protein FtsL [Geomonas limicola]